MPAGGLSDPARRRKRPDPQRPGTAAALDKVRPIHEVVRVDYFIPGCPPSGPAIWKVFLTDLIAGRTPRPTGGLLHYDCRGKRRQEACGNVRPKSLADEASAPVSP